MCKNIKKRLFIIFALLILIISGIAIFFYSNLIIYNTPYSIFKDSNARPFFKKKIIPNWQCYQSEHTLPNPNTDLELLSWNIYKGINNNWSEDLHQLSQNKHFVLLQEATSLQAITDQLLQFKSFLHTFAFEFQNHKSGILNLTTLNANLYCMNGLIEPIIRLPKLISAMRFPFENDHSLLVINVHLINFDLTEDSYLQQLDNLKSLIKFHNGAIILAGDFNTWNDKRDLYLANLIKELNLNSIKISPDERITFLGHPLDYIFTRGIIVHSAVSNSLKSSDHNPIELRFSLQ